MVVMLFIANSCKKPSSPAPEFLGIYQASNSINLSPVFMYTQNGQVTDQAVIGAYLNKNGFLNGYFDNIDSMIPSNFTFEVNFIDGNTATWIQPAGNSTTSAGFSITQKSSTGFILEAFATTPSVTYPIYQTRTDSLIAQTNSIDMFSNCKPVLAEAGSAQECTFRQAYPFIIKNGQLYLLSYNCAITGHFPYKSSSAAANVVGVFNTDITKQLNAGDTVLTQIRTILLTQ